MIPAQSSDNPFEDLYYIIDYSNEGIVASEV
jgi:hypothetical protein